MTFEKADISFRIGVPQWISEQRFQALLSLFEKYKGVTDEIAFFTSTTHPPIPLKTMKERCEVLADRISRARKLGYRAGINILSTMGHHNENLANSLSGDYQRVTDLDGNISHGSFCVNTEPMRDVIRQTYELMAKADPDFIWIDDDIRFLWHWPVRETCFCDTCLKIFEQQTGIKHTRATLKAALNTGDPKSKLAIRKHWLQFNRNTINRLFEMIEKTVHDLKPNLALGFMTGERFYEGYDFDRWARTLAGPKQVEVMWRPGGGFYNDGNLGEMIGKAHEIGRQTAFLPEWVRSIQSEIENFPYQRLKKSAHVTTLEGAVYQAAGSTGTAFNVLTMSDEPLDEFEPLLAKIQATRPFYDLLARHIGRAAPLGVYTGWNKDTISTANLTEGEWLGGELWRLGGHYANEVFENGIPAAYLPQNACMTILTSNLTAVMSDSQIKQILSTGVYLDASALCCLNQMGYSELTGFSVERELKDDCIEQLVDHPLNGPFAGRERDARQSFYKGIASILVPQDKNAQSLSRLIDYTNREVAPCLSGIFENRLGGRVCVAGYYPWTFLQSLSKSRQIKSIFRWLAKDELSGFIGSYHKINLWIRKPEQGKVVAAMVNSSLDSAENVELLLNGCGESITVYDMECKPIKISSTGTDGGYRTFILPKISPWSMLLVTG